MMSKRNNPLNSARPIDSELANLRAMAEAEALRRRLPEIPIPESLAHKFTPADDSVLLDLLFTDPSEVY